MYVYIFFTIFKLFFLTLLRSYNTVWIVLYSHNKKSDFKNAQMSFLELQLYRSD